MAEDRLDRLESNLERHAEESDQRMTRLERFLANFSKDVARNAADANERLDRIEKLVAPQRPTNPISAGFDTRPYLTARAARTLRLTPVISGQLRSQASWLQFTDH